jgi:hypothetical protein
MQMSTQYRKYLIRNKKRKRSITLNSNLRSDVAAAGRFI